jgi:hypothetical protein
MFSLVIHTYYSLSMLLKNKEIENIIICDNK